MSRSIALLPFEVSLLAPEPVQLAGEEAGDAPDDQSQPVLEGEQEERAEEESGQGAEFTADAPGDGTSQAEPGRETAGEEELSEESEYPERSEYFENSEHSENIEGSEDTENAEGAEAPDAARGAGWGGAEGSLAGASGAEPGPDQPESGAGASDGAAGVERGDEGGGEAGASLDDDAEDGFDGEEDRFDGEEASGDAGDETAWLSRGDQVALARWLRSELAALLFRAEVLAPILIELEGEAEEEADELDALESSLDAGPAAGAARAAGAELGLLCRVRADARSVELSGLVADAAGEERVRFALASPLGEAHLLPLRAAAEVLLAMGEDAAAAALPDAGEETLPGQAVLLLCRGAHALAEARLAPPGDPLADPLPGAGDLLEALALAPGLLAARDRILAAAAEAADGASMPTWLGVLEQLELSLPGDVLTLSALAGYRRLHHDLEGARDLLLRARDLAEEGREEAQVLGELAALAEQEGRGEEAVQHLRAASRIDDDPLWHLRLGLLLRLREPQESARSFQRAVVLAPESPRPRLELARQLQLLGETGRAATEAARAAQLSRKDPALAQAAAELLRALMEGPR